MNSATFQRDYPGIETVLTEIIQPVFGDTRPLHEDMITPYGLQQSADAAKIKTITRIAEYDLDGTPFNIFDVALSSSADLSRNRVAIKKLLISQVDVFSSSLIFFHYADCRDKEWRVSYFAKGSGNADTTAAKRYTFLCGQSHGCRTIAERFELLGREQEKTRNMLTSVFSVESLNKEFYKKLSNWFFWALKVVRFPEGAKDSKKNAVPLIRLITRIIFVWFMKKKGLVPEQLFRKSFADAALRAGCDESAYYKAILQNLFFATLNTEPTEPKARKFISAAAKDGSNRQYHVFSVYRYEDFFTSEGKTQFLALMRDIPFLNGGLFACLDDNKENIAIDAFSDNPVRRKMLCVPDELFWTTEEEKRRENLNDAYGDEQHGKEQVLGLITLLEQYNFTIDENSREEATVALDPELLGVVFENLLASYNPETATTARKQTGSFYTPREIVDYMVTESIIRYLLSRKIRDLSEECIRELLSNDTPPQLSKTQRKAIAEAIQNCRILDPACGSGAFPMGLLQNLVRILEKLDPVGSSGDLYRRKLHLIQNCIYGVDMQPIAVQISKLRCFISLLADSEINEASANRGIEPLPNLEMHFVAANSLLDVDLSAFDEWSNDPQIAELTGQLKQLREKYFSAKSHAQKRKLRQQDDELRTKLQKALVRLAKGGNREKISALQKRIADLTSEQSQYAGEKWEELVPREEAELFPMESAETDGILRIDANAVKRDEIQKQIAECQRALKKELRVDNEAICREAAKLADWDPFNQMAAASFFNPKWMFGSAEDFHIVIGNPPYVRADNPDRDYQLERKAIKDSGTYETLWEKWDLFVPFLERGYKMLAPDGVETFIVSDAYCHSKYARKSQEWFLLHARIPRIDFCGDLKIFEASVHNVIPFFEKTDGTVSTPLRRLHTEKFGNVSNLPSDEQSKLTYRAFFPENGTEKECISGNITLENVCYISKGMVINADEKIARNAFKIDDLITEKRDKIHCKKFVEGKDLAKWFFDGYKYLEWGTDRAPVLFSRPTFPELYNHPEKLMLPMVGEIRAAIDTKRMLCNHGIFVCVPWIQLKNIRNRSIKKYCRYCDETPVREDLPHREALEELSVQFNIKFLLGVLNSSMARQYLLANRRNNVQFYPDDWKKLPIPEATPAQQRPIIALVEKILAAKAADPSADVSMLEQHLDLLVANLYEQPKMIKSPDSLC